MRFPLARFWIATLVVTATFGKGVVFHCPKAAEPPPARSVSGVGPADDPTRQTDADWTDDRWQRTEIGSFLCATIGTPRRPTFKGIAIRVGEAKEGTVCFDTDLLRYSAGWTGGFLELNPKRYGLITAPKPHGTIQFESPSGPGWDRQGSFHDPRSRPLGPLPKRHAHFQGFYRHGQRVILAYTVGETKVLDSPGAETHGGVHAFTRTVEMAPRAGTHSLRVCDGPGAVAKHETVNGVPLVVLVKGDQITAIGKLGNAGELEIANDSEVQLKIEPRMEPVRLKILLFQGNRSELPAFARLVRESPPPMPLRPLTSGGPSVWREPVVTLGRRGLALGPFAIDTLTLPHDNPWRALLFASGHDFFENGEAALCTIHGDVWVVSGIDHALERLVWRRFATGLHQPLGLKIVDDLVYVLERDRITRLHDLNRDGEADFYENFNNDCISAGGGHSFATCLETDSAGNFWFVKCAEETPHGGSALRVARDGSRLEVIATGFRNPNGLSVGPGDVVTVADQQGNWVPETRLDLIRPGGFYGFMPMHKRPTAPANFDPPLCWIARAADNSAGGQVWVPAGTWGPLAERMVHLSYGRCTMMLVLQDEQDPLIQAAVVPLPGRFLSGVMRGRFNPSDGHLYLSGLRGWQTAAVADGCLQRVRLTGVPLRLPVGYAVLNRGIQLTFSEPLDPEIAEDVESYAVECWNYRWSSQYGSPDYSVSDPNREGRDPMPLKTVHLSADRKSVALEFADFQPAMQVRIQYNVDTAGGDPIRGEIFATVNRIP